MSHCRQKSLRGASGRVASTKVAIPLIAAGIKQIAPLLCSENVGKKLEAVPGGGAFCEGAAENKCNK